MKFLASSLLMILTSSVTMASTTHSQELQEEVRYLRAGLVAAPDGEDIHGTTGRILAPPAPNGQGGTTKNTNNNKTTLTLGASNECITTYNHDICQKFVNIRNDLEKGRPFDMAAFKLLKQQMKDIRKSDPKRKDFKDAIIKVLDKNKDKQEDKDEKELVLEVLDELDSLDLKEVLATELEYGYSEADEMATIDPYAGQDSDFPLEMYEDDVSEGAGGGGGRRLGVPATTSRWANGIVKYSVAFEYDYSGYWRWVEKILPAMNEIEELTEIVFELQNYYWTYDSAPSNGQLYVTAVPSGCAAHIGAPPSNGKHRLFIGPACPHGSIMHELLHAIGMAHQQSASYRDRYITVNYPNILTANAFNFDRLSSNHGYEFVYDYGSIMHYGEYAFAKDSNYKTIDCRGNRCGQRDGLSYWDVWEIFYYNRGYYALNTGL